MRKHAPSFVGQTLSGMSWIEQSCFSSILSGVLKVLQAVFWYSIQATEIIGTTSMLLRELRSSVNIASVCYDDEPGINV